MNTKNQTVNKKSVSTILKKRKIVYFSNSDLKSKKLMEIQNFTLLKKTKISKMAKPLYIIDLSGIFSKYIDETEKNLNKIFELVKDMNGILLFDEADALFGKRDKIKNASNKYANLDTNYLLRKLVKYSKMMFLSSNFQKPLTKKDIDKLDYIICFSIKK